MKRLFYIMMFLFCYSYGMAQDKTVSGLVLDSENGLPLIGASIVEVGTSNIVISDEDGAFSINVANDTATLEISYIGYLNVTVNATDDLSNIKLSSDSQLLDELVVVGYGTIKKSDHTGAVSSVKSKDLAKVANVDATQALQGKVAGVSIKLNSGEPGAGTSVNIRGVGSINDSSPLYVVDGISVSDISHIAPSDIESIEVLKDASATAIYGSLGSNGVVMIKTKGGTLNQKAVVTANIYASVMEVSNRIDMLNAYEYAVLKQEAMANGGVAVSSEWQQLFDNAIDNHLEGTDWQDEIFRTAHNQNYNVNVAGGTDKIKYDIGATYAKEEGVVKNTYLDKFMAHANNEYKFNDHVKLGLNIYYTNFKKTGNNSDYYTGPLVGALRADPVSLAFDPETNDFGEIYCAFGTNPARAVDENKYKSQWGDRLAVNSYLQFDDIFINGLSFRAQFGSTLDWKTSRDYLPVYFVISDQQRAQSSLNEQRSTNKEWTTSEYFNYNKETGEHSINAMVGFEASKKQYDYSNVTAYDVPESADLRYLSASTSSQYLVKGTLNHSSLASFFARVNYSLSNKYLLTATVRADGSSKFVDHWGYFPSFSAGWNISNEDFMDNASDLFSNLRLRAGWGQVGNQNAAGNHDYAAVMTSGYYYVFGGSIVDGSVQQSIANTELAWETSEQVNIGVDFGLWKDKLTGTLDYFIRNTNDMILATPIPIYTGYAKPNTNAGSLSNKGVELTLNYSHWVNEDFSFNLGVNFATIKNEVTNIGGSDPIEGGNLPVIGNTTRTEVGHEIAYYYGLKTDGIFNSQEELDSYTKDGVKIQPDAEPGDVKFVDLNNDGVIDEDDRTKLGSAIPDLSMGFNASFVYKNIDFNMSLQGSFGNELVNGMYYTTCSSDMREWNVSTAMLDRWTPENPTSNTPRLTASDPNDNCRFSDRFVEDGSYLRVSNIQLGYNMPKNIVDKIKLQQLRFYISANNLLTFTKYTGFDPEVGGTNLDSGVDIATYPIPRTISIGCNIKF